MSRRFYYTLLLKTTIVYVTHGQVEAMTMGTKIVIMKDGEIHQVGSPMGQKVSMVAVPTFHPGNGGLRRCRRRKQ